MQCDVRNIKCNQIESLYSEIKLNLSVYLRGVSGPGGQYIVSP